MAGSGFAHPSAEEKGKVLTLKLKKKATLFESKSAAKILIYLKGENDNFEEFV